MPARTIEVKITGTDRSGPALESAARGFQNLGQQAERTSGILSRIGGTFGSIATQAAGMFGGLLAFDAIGRAAEFVGDSFIGLNNRLEQSRIAFGTMMGSGEEAERFLDDLSKFAAQTPFDFPGLTDAAKRLMAFGFAAQEVIPFMTSIGDAAAAMGGGTEMVNRLTTALGQMRAKGKVQAEEMLQLTEAGIPAWDMLAKKLGTDVATAMDMVSKRTVDAGTMITAFQEGVASRFGGQMAKQARTFAGALSTVTDSLQMAVAKGAKPLFDELTTIMVGFADWLSGDTFAGWVAGLTSGMQSVARVFVGAIGFVRDFFAYLDDANQTDYARRIFGDFGPVVDQVVRTVKGLTKAFGYLFGGDTGMFLELFQEWAGIDLGPLVGAIEAIGNALGDLLSTGDLGVFADDIREAFNIDLGPLIRMVQGYVQMLGNIGGALADLVRTGDFTAFFARVGEAIQAFAPTVLTYWRSLLDTLVGAIVQYGPQILAQLQTWGRALIDWIAPMIPPLLTQLGQLVAQAWAWVQGQAPIWLAQLQAWGQALWSWVQPQIPVVLGQLQALAGQVLGWIGQQAGPILAQLGQWAQQFAAWAVPAVTAFLQAWPQTLNSILDQIGAAAVPILEQLGKWALAFGKWLIPALPGILEALAGVALAITVFIVETAATILVKLGQWAIAFVKWVAPLIPPLLVELGNLLLALGGWITNTALPAIVTQVGLWAKAMVDWVRTTAVPAIGPAIETFGKALLGSVAALLPGLRDMGLSLGKGLLGGLLKGLAAVSIPMPTFTIKWATVEIPKALGGGSFQMPVGIDVGVVWQSIGAVIEKYLKDMGLAEGTADWRGGLALLGERGPEWAVLPRHTEVYPTGTGPALATENRGQSIDYDRLGVAVARALAGTTLELNDRRQAVLGGLRGAGVL